MIKQTLQTIGIASIIALTLTGCSTTDITPTPTTTPTAKPTTSIPTSVNDISTEVSTQNEGKYIVGPVRGTLSEFIKAKTVKVPVGSKLYVMGIDKSEYETWTATSSSPDVAAFVNGIPSPGVGVSGTTPSFNVTSEGTTNIIMTNPEGKKFSFSIEGIIQ